MRAMYSGIWRPSRSFRRSVLTCRGVSARRHRSCMFSKSSTTILSYAGKRSILVSRFACLAKTVGAVTEQISCAGQSRVLAKNVTTWSPHHKGRAEGVSRPWGHLQIVSGSLRQENTGHKLYILGGYSSLYGARKRHNIDVGVCRNVPCFTILGAHHCNDAVVSIKSQHQKSVFGITTWLLRFVPPSSLVRVSVPLPDLDRAIWKSPGYRIGGGELEALGIVQQKARKDSDSKTCIEDTVSEENAR